MYLRGRKFCAPESGKVLLKGGSIYQNGFFFKLLTPPGSFIAQPAPLRGASPFIAQPVPLLERGQGAGLLLAFLLDQCLLRESLLPYLSDALCHVGEVLGHEHGIVGQQGGQGDGVLVLAAEFRHQGNGFHTLAAELALDLEGADAVDLRAEKINAKGEFAGVGEHVDERPADGKLPGFVDVVSAMEAKLQQRLLHKIEIHAFARPQLQRPLVQRLLRHHSLSNSFGVGNDKESLSTSPCGGESFVSAWQISGGPEVLRQ